MIQNLNTMFYKASKYRCSSQALWQTPTKMYNQCIQVYSKIKTNSEHFILPKKYVKHSAKPQTTENLSSSNNSEKLSRFERSKLIKKQKQQAYYDRLNHPNYNHYSPLSEKFVINKKGNSNMVNTLARINFRTMLDSATNAAKAKPLSKTSINENTKPNADTEQTNIQTQDNQLPTSETATTTSSTEGYLQLVSNKYAPKNLTLTPSKINNYDNFKDNKDTSFAIVIRIGQKKTEQLQFNEGRILTAIITSFQNVMPLIRIVPIENKRATASDIESPEDIIFDEDFYSNYMEDPKYTTNRQLVFRLHFISKKPFFWYKKNIQLQKWLKNEMIRLEENNIPEIHCPKVGFLTDCHPRVSMVAIYEDRIKQLFPNITLPPFYCAIENISVRHATTKVIIIRSAESNVNEFLKLFRSATKDNINTFIPWNQWIAMIPGKQLDLIQRQNGVLTNIKSLIISGFKNNENTRLNYSALSLDTSIMADDDDIAPAETETNLSNMTVQEFLLQNYKDINGEPIFQFCYPVSLGIRELNVNSNHAHEAIHLCKVIKQDMLLYMSDDAASAIFEDVKSLADQAKSHSPWIPYDIETNYIPVESEENYEAAFNDRKKTKRTNNNDSKIQSNYSYKTAVTNNITKEINNIPTSNNPSSAITKTKPTNHHTITDELLSLKSQLLVLQTNQKTFEEKSDAKTNKLIIDMKKMQNDNKCTKEDVTSIKNQMQEMTTKTWMENRFEKMDTKFDKMDKVMDYMLHYMDSNNRSNNKKDYCYDDMNIDKDILKRSNYEISEADTDNHELYDHEKENYARGGNQINCNNQPDIFGKHNP
jgi:hypothetical protein